MPDKLTVWIGIISSIITIVLSVMNFNLKSDMLDINRYVKKVETELKEKEYALEKSKEKTSRYEFVNKILPDLLQEDQEQVVLTTNLIALVLDEGETEQLFKGFLSSEKKQIKNVGNIGIQTIETIQKNKTKYQLAIEYEEKGFRHLIDGEYDDAIKAFSLAEKTYPTFHQVYEIGKLLKENKTKMKDESIKKSVLYEIAYNLSWKAPKQHIIKLKEMAN